MLPESYARPNEGGNSIELLLFWLLATTKKGGADGSAEAPKHNEQHGEDQEGEGEDHGQSAGSVQLISETAKHVGGGRIGAAGHGLLEAVHHLASHGCTTASREHAYGAQGGIDEESEHAGQRTEAEAASCGDVLVWFAPGVEGDRHSTGGDHAEQDEGHERDK